MRWNRLARGVLITGCALLFLALLPSPSGTVMFPAPEEAPTVSLLYASSGSLPQLLNTGQNRRSPDSGSRSSRTPSSRASASGSPFRPRSRHRASGRTPPSTSWCCEGTWCRRTPTLPPSSLPSRRPRSTGRTTRIPLAENITAAWVFGKKPILTPQGTLDPLDIERRSFQNMVFTADADPPESAIVRYRNRVEVWRKCDLRPPGMGRPGRRGEGRRVS